MRYNAAPEELGLPLLSATGVAKALDSDLGIASPSLEWSGKESIEAR